MYLIGSYVPTYVSTVGNKIPGLLVIKEVRSIGWPATNLFGFYCGVGTHMAQSLRGTRMGANSYESDKTENAPRLLTDYICPSGHRFTLPFSLEANEIPEIWECDCGETALRQGIKRHVGKVAKIPKSHYDMLMERRTKKDLEGLLKERVELIRKPKKAS
jgi:hypothetical protein